MQSFQDQRETLKSVATALKGNGVPFALAGGYAVWARGGPESTHDVDFVVPPDAADTARKVLLETGHEEEESTEDWLDKVRRGEVVVDMIHRLPTGDVDQALLDRCSEASVDSVMMPVLSATDLLLSRILAFSEHACDFGGPLMWSRALREQIDWGEVSQRAGDNPFGRAFLTLVQGLGVAEVDRVD